MKNNFGLRIYTPSEIFSDSILVSYLRSSLRSMLKFLEYDGKETSEFIEKTFHLCSPDNLKKFAKQSNDTIEYDLSPELLDYYSSIDLFSRLKKWASGRSEHISSYIIPFLGSGSILDIGTGNAVIAKKIYDSGFKNIELADIFDNRSPLAKEIPFHLIKEGVTLPLKDKSFDTTLLIAVLHHSGNPLHLLDEALRVTRKRILVYESVSGVGKDCISESVYNENSLLYDQFFDIGSDRQCMYGVFLDWYLNKVDFKNKANVPFNFNTPSGWEKVFEERNLTVVHKEFVGFDNPGISEFHVWYVLDV